MHSRWYFMRFTTTESKQETRYRPGKSKGAGYPTPATRPHFKPWSYSRKPLYGFVCYVATEGRPGHRIRARNCGDFRPEGAVSRLHGAPCYGDPHHYVDA